MRTSGVRSAGFRLITPTRVAAIGRLSRGSGR
jgi:hypothetical protein